jgi:hypothetical protein
MIYEMGIPIVELGDDKWHVNVMQKVPLSRDRDNVNPSYLRKIHQSVLNAKFEELTTAEDAAAAWVRDAISSPKSSDEAVKHVMNARFGAKHVSRDVRDKGSANEAVSQGHKIIEGGSLSAEEWARYKAVKDKNGESVLKTSAEVAPTDVVGPLPQNLIIPEKQWTPAMKSYAKLIALISPKLIAKPVIVHFINDEDNHIEGCFSRGFHGNKSKKGFVREWGIMAVNLAYHDPSSAFENYSLLLHELAHDKVRSNDHLHHEFYDTVNDLGAKLAVLIQDEPRLFDTFDFTDGQSVWNAASYPEICGDAVPATNAARGSTARRSRVEG